MSAVLFQNSDNTGHISRAKSGASGLGALWPLHSHLSPKLLFFCSTTPSTWLPSCGPRWLPRLQPSHLVSSQQNAGESAHKLPLTSPCWTVTWPHQQEANWRPSADQDSKTPQTVGTRVSNSSGLLASLPSLASVSSLRPPQRCQAGVRLSHAVLNSQLFPALGCLSSGTLLLLSS